MDIPSGLASVLARIDEITGGFSPPSPPPSAAQAPAPGAGFGAFLSDAVAGASSAGIASFIRPVEGSVTSPFGTRQNPFGAGTDFHPGIDIAADEGTPIRAAVAGTVVSAGPDGGYGNAIVVDDGNGVTTRYAHCSQIFARVGESVAQGAVIGAVGSTGRSTGPHLHFEVRKNGSPVDPASLLQ